MKEVEVLVQSHYSCKKVKNCSTDMSVEQFKIPYVVAERISMAPFCHKQHLVLRQSAEWDLTRAASFSAFRIRLLEHRLLNQRFSSWVILQFTQYDADLSAGYSRSRRWGNRITSRMLGVSVKSMTRRSTPKPKPPLGGIP